MLEFNPIEKNQISSESKQWTTGWQNNIFREAERKRDEENTELLVNYETIDKIEKQYIIEKIVKLILKDNLSNPTKLRRINRVRM